MVGWWLVGGWLVVGWWLVGGWLVVGWWFIVDLPVKNGDFTDFQRSKKDEQKITESS